MKKLRIVLFKGNSFIAKLIHWQTRSEYTHVGIVIYDSDYPGEHKLYEAYHIGGVRSDRNYYTLLDETEAYIIPGLVGDTVDMVESFLKSKVGLKYDFLSVARFVSRREAPRNDRYFCSELVVDALSSAQVYILRGPAAKFSPRDISISPMLIRARPGLE